MEVILNGQKKVDSFNGRTGKVVPQSGDYSASDIGAYSTSETDKLLQQKPNPNLLDNPRYTVNGTDEITIGTTTGYYIDCWRKYGSDTTGNVQNGIVYLDNSGSATCGWQQRIEAKRLEANRQYTFSVLIKPISTSYTGSNINIALSYGKQTDSNDGTSWITSTIAPFGSWSLASYTFTLPSSTDGMYNFRVRCLPYATKLYIGPIKLELGTQQTLAHQDSSGEWVLNDPPPNYWIPTVSVDTGGTGRTSVTAGNYLVGNGTETLQEKTSEEVREHIGARSNENLLDNWYFLNPINQRNLTTYTNSGYTIDRWRHYAGSSVSVVDNGIQITRLNDSDTIYFAQYIESFSQLIEKTFTFSIYITNINADSQDDSYFGDLAYVYKKKGYGTTFASKVSIMKNDSGVISYTVKIPYNADELELFGVGVFVNTYHSSINDSITISAAKLELGTQQTLAHQDSSGNWVLNDPPPNYALELAKCQRYQIELANKADNKYGFIGTGPASSTVRAIIFIPFAFAIPLAKTPSVSFTGMLRLAPYGSWASGTVVTKISIDHVSGSGVNLYVDVESGLTAGTWYELVYTPPTDDSKNSILIDANL